MNTFLGSGLTVLGVEKTGWDGSEPDSKDEFGRVCERRRGSTHEVNDEDKEMSYHESSHGMKRLYSDDAFDFESSVTVILQERMGWDWTGGD